MVKTKRDSEYDGLSRTYRKHGDDVARLEWEWQRIADIVARLPPRPRVLVVSGFDARHMRCFGSFGADTICILRDEDAISQARVMSKTDNIIPASELVRRETEAAFDCIWFCCPESVAALTAAGYREYARMLSDSGIVAVLVTGQSDNASKGPSGVPRSVIVRQGFERAGLAFEEELHMPAGQDDASSIMILRKK